MPRLDADAEINASVGVASNNESACGANGCHHVVREGDASNAAADAQRDPIASIFIETLTGEVS